MPTTKTNPEGFGVIVRTLFAPIYPVIADQIIAKTGVVKGRCLDMGCGPGPLGMALAKKTDLFIRFYDISPEMIEMAEAAIVENGLQERAATMVGDVAKIDLPDASADLIVSRGSIFFWEDLPSAFREIERILAPGGWTYIGGGFGTRELREKIKAEMAKRDADNGEPFKNKVGRNLGPETRARFAAALEEAGIAQYSIIEDEEAGLWIVIQK